MNPCPCGWLGDTRKECTCTSRQIENYRGRLSGPIIDRIDLHIRLNSVDIKEAAEGMDSRTMAEQVQLARNIQKQRYKNQSFHLNSHIPAGVVKEYCPMEEEAGQLLQKAYRQLPLTMRSYHKIIRVARTIADLEGDDKIAGYHMAEAIHYRE